MNVTELLHFSYIFVKFYYGFITILLQFNKTYTSPSKSKRDLEGGKIKTLMSSLNKPLSAFPGMLKPTLRYSLQNIRLR